MSMLYYGSSQSGLSRLAPHPSTHGNFVYATRNKELAIVFSGKCGDDLIYTLFRNSDDEPWQIVERIPGAFSKMFQNSSSIYSVSDTTFQDIHTGFSELISEEKVNVEKEERVESVYEKLKELEKEGKVKLYHYPNRPKSIPVDDNDLIEREIKMASRSGQKITKKIFRRLLYLHPNLFSLVNQKLSSLSSNDLFTEQDLVENFENFILQQMIFPDREQYLSLSVQEIDKTFPELLPQIQEKLSILEDSKQEQVDYLVDKLFKTIPSFPKKIVEQAKEYYEKDKRNFSEIGREILDEYQKIQMMENLVNQDIDFNVCNQSILMIGPMASGKSTISKKIGENMTMPVISLDDRKQLSQYYSKQKNFSHFKDFEFYLTASTLTNLKVPAVINFGAGHSIYEDDIMFYEMKKLISKFSNVVYLLPSQDKVESERILQERLQKRDYFSASQLQDNHHFLNSGCNEELATIMEYTDSKSVDEVACEILSKIDEKNKKREKKSGNIRTLKKQDSTTFGFTHFMFLFIFVLMIIFGLILVNILI